MKVVKRTCNVPHAEIIRCNLRVSSGFGLSSLMHFVRACVRVCQRVSECAYGWKKVRTEIN